MVGDEFSRKRGVAVVKLHLQRFLIIFNLLGQVAGAGLRSAETAQAFDDSGKSCVFMRWTSTATLLFFSIKST
jgi:hypothetical protein